VLTLIGLNTREPLAPLVYDTGFYIPVVGRITSHVLFNSMLVQHCPFSTLAIFTTTLFHMKLPWQAEEALGEHSLKFKSTINGHLQNSVSHL